MAKERWLPPIRCMHEWPLVLFTALVVPAAGMYASTLIADLAGLPYRLPTYLRGLAAGLLAAGLLFSFLHLGRPRRAPLALRRFGRNSLSTEAGFAAALLALALVLLVPSWASNVMLRLLAGACAGAVLLTFGLVYFLRGHSPWRSAVVAGPLLSGLSTGSVLLVAAPDNIAVLPIALVLTAADGVFCLAVWREARVQHPLPAHPAIHMYRRRLLALRLIFANVLPAGLLIAGFAPSAAIAVGMGVLLDRVSFYGLARVQTTEATVAAVERQIEATNRV